jgi:hypothetical protein
MPVFVTVANAISQMMQVMIQLRVIISPATTQMPVFIVKKRMMASEHNRRSKPCNKLRWSV